MDKYGIIGWPVKHSLSPAMHNAAFKKLGIDAEYGKFEVKPEELEDFILKGKEVVGFNVTVPYKVKAMEILKNTDRLIHGEADKRYIEFSNAINTVKREGEVFRCANTDVAGFTRSLEHDLKFEHKDKNVFLIGCGGAGRAVIAGLTSPQNSCNKIYIFDTDAKTIESAKIFFGGFVSLKDKLEFISDEQPAGKIKDSQLLVNASPVGMKEGDASVIDKKLLHKGLSVYDVVYNRETELVKDAKSLGLPAVGGLGMLLYQGAHSFEFWTGKKAPIDVMRKALRSALKQ